MIHFWVQMKSKPAWSRGGSLVTPPILRGVFENQKVFFNIHVSSVRGVLTESGDPPILRGGFE